MIECFLLQDIQKIEIMTRPKRGGKENTKQKKGKSTKRNIAPVEEQHVEEISTGNDRDDLSAHENETDHPAQENETDHLSATSQVLIPKIISLVLVKKICYCWCITGATSITRKKNYMTLIPSGQINK